MTTAAEPRTDDDHGRRPVTPTLGPRAMLRWAWRSLTSMRTALILLLLLALAAVPGSVVPQEAVDSNRASQWQEAHPRLTPLYDRLGLFDVYGSPWFAAIYLLLTVSLVGCIVPRLRVYFRAVRARPPKAPKNLRRLAGHGSFETETSVEEAVEAARTLLRRRRFRVDVADGPGGREVRAERGYLREAGNLLFHLSILVVLAGFAIGGLWGFRGGVLVVTEQGFANTLSQYDEFKAGGLFEPRSLTPFDFTVDDFSVEFIRQGRELGMARKFSADLTYHRAPGAPSERETIAVNHPLNIDGTEVFLLSHGYAPRITVRNADGSLAFSGPVVFLPEDQTYRSFGVVKVPDATQPVEQRASSGRSDQIGLEGQFFPTYAEQGDRESFSAYPDLFRPAIQMQVWRGDLGLDTGESQSVYALGKPGMVRVLDPDGKRPLLLTLAVGQTQQLPDGLGSVTLDGVNRYVKLQISRTPAQWVTLLGVVVALLGLLASLFVRSRRVWVRVTDRGGCTLVEVGGLDRASRGDLDEEIAQILAALPGGPPVKETT